MIDNDPRPEDETSKSGHSDTYSEYGMPESEYNDAVEDNLGSDSPDSSDPNGSEHSDARKLPASDIEAAEAFEDLHEHDSTPSIPLTKVERHRFNQLAKNLEDAKLQAYIEANLGSQVLKVIQQIVPLLAGAL